MRTDRSSLLVAELALVALTLSVLAGFNRIFSDWSFLRETVIMALASHGLAIAGRRFGWPLPLVTVVSAVSMVVLGSALFYPDTLRWALPTAGTWEAFTTDLDASWSAFGDVVAPTAPTQGFVASAAVGVWLVAFLADWAAFRIRSVVEAVAPAAVLWFFASAFAREPHRLWGALVFAAAVLGFVLAHRVMRQEQAAAWTGRSPARARWGSLAAGALVGGVVLTVGAVAGPTLPGATDEAVVAWRDIGDGPGTRVTVSPLVEIQSRLVDLPSTEVFTVATDQPDYWRLTSLDRFDGSVWGSSLDGADASGVLDTRLPPGTATSPVEQTFRIGALGDLWAPAAYEPRQILTGDASLRYDPESASLLVDDSLGSSDQLTYTVRSEVPRRDPAAIAAASAAVPAGIAGAYLTLPEDFSPEIRALAIDVTAGTTSPYESALALQDFFRDGSFAYDIDIERGHGVDSMEDFLFDVRAGYCEQFAGSYAAMARAVGLPARVAVGFTPGEYDPAAGVWRVRGEHAHAWPEVYLDGIGWLRFEPTPGRGAPGDGAYTNRPPDQQGGFEPAADDPATVPEPADPAPGPLAPEGVPEDLVDVPSVGGSGSSAATGSSPWDHPLVLALIGLVAATGVGAVVHLVGVRRRASLTRRIADDPSARLELAWRRTDAAAGLLGARRHDWETPVEWARRASPVLGPSAPDVAQLADTVTDSVYAATPVSSDQADDADGAVAVLERRVATLAGPWQRIRRWLDPRLVPGARRR